MRQLLPGSNDTVDLEALYVRVPRPQPVGRPWMIGSMITSLDGATAVDGRSRGLGSPADVAIFHLVRQAADLVLVGASTARTERYRPSSVPGQRIAVVSRSATLDVTTELFTSGRGLVITTTDAPDLPVPTIRAGEDQVDLADALRQLHADGARIVACEGGGHLNGSLLSADLIDEWCWTVSPLLVSGPSGRGATGGHEHVTRLELAHLCEEDGYLFTRYARP